MGTTFRRRCRKGGEEKLKESKLISALRNVQLQLEIREDLCGLRNIPPQWLYQEPKPCRVPRPESKLLSEVRGRSLFLWEKGGDMRGLLTAPPGYVSRPGIHL